MTKKIDIVQKIEKLEKIKIAKSFKFGYELELLVPYEMEQDFNNAIGDIHCDTTSDGSISGDGEPIEVRTPPLGYNAMIRTLTKLQKVLNKYEAGTNSSCGVHLHTSNKRFYQRKHLLDIMYSWLAIEDVIFATQPASRLNNHYCQRLLGRYVNEEVMSRNEYIQKLPVKKGDIMDRASSVDRYCSFNINSLGSSENSEHGHGTLEVRVFAGSKYMPNLIAYLELVRNFYEYCLTRYNKNEITAIFEMYISEEKINKVWELLRLSDKTKLLLNKRIHKNSFRALKAQQEGAIKYKNEYQGKVKKAVRNYRKAQEVYEHINNEVDNVRGLFR